MVLACGKKAAGDKGGGMVTDDVSVQLCRGSPVQKEWKPKVGDNTNKGVITYIGVWREKGDTLTCWIGNVGYSKIDLIYTPRQEEAGR